MMGRRRRCNGGHPDVRRGFIGLFWGADHGFARTQKARPRSPVANEHRTDMRRRLLAGGVTSAGWEREGGKGRRQRLPRMWGFSNGRNSHICMDMGRVLDRILVHLVFSADRREPLLGVELRPRLFACLGSALREMGCDPIAVNGMADHVHLMFRLHAGQAVAEVTKRLKAHSSGMDPSHIAIPEGIRMAERVWGVQPIAALVRARAGLHRRPGGAPPAVICRGVFGAAGEEWGREDIVARHPGVRREANAGKITFFIGCFGLSTAVAGVPAARQRRRIPTSRDRRPGAGVECQGYGKTPFASE